MKQTLKGAVIASAVAALFAMGAAHAEGKGEAKEGGKGVRCAGVNECKGKGSCHGADNTCAGQNSCKGKGWVMTKSEKECKDKGGTVSKS